MSAWHVRQEGATEVYELPSEADVLAALRDGHFVPADEVKGPADLDWRPLETHPAFAEAALDAEPRPVEAADDTHLDMNPLIDVCLVLLIFFILTISYATLERAIAVPEDNAQEKGSQKLDIKQQDVKDRVFIVTAKMDGEKPVIKMGVYGALKEVSPAQLKTEMGALIDTTGRREMVLDIERDVPWGIETLILDAATGNKLHGIINNQRMTR
jgi:biopolymer transport protein ExbD